DVSDELIGALQTQPSYRVHEVGEGGRDLVVDGYRAIDSREHPELVAAEIARADIVTTAVGARILQFVAPLIVAGRAERRADATPPVALACATAIAGTALLASSVAELGGKMGRAIWANCGIDRTVPEQHGGLDVTPEAFWEWAVDATPFGGDTPQLAGVHW